MDFLGPIVPVEISFPCKARIWVSFIVGRIIHIISSDAGDAIQESALLQ